MALMRAVFYLFIVLAFAGSFAFADDPTPLPELVEAYLQHPDFISQNYYLDDQMPRRASKKSNTTYFDVPDDRTTDREGYIDIVRGRDPHASARKKAAEDALMQQQTKGCPSSAASQSQNMTPPSENFLGSPNNNTEIIGLPGSGQVFPPTESSSNNGMMTNYNDEVTGHAKTAQCSPPGDGFTVNFENISVVELLQFISQISGTNFIFDSADLQFNITIVSQEAASVTELTSSLLQILKMHSLSVVEQGNTVLIYRQQNLSRVSKVITDANVNESCDAAVVTRVFRLYNVDPKKIAEVVKPLLSSDAIVEVSSETRHLIVSDITYNVDKIAQLLNALDTPNTLFELAEYHVNSSYPEALVAYAKEILAPLLVDNPMQMIAQPSSHKIFIVSTPFLIQKALNLLSSLDSADVMDVGDLPSTSIANNVMYMYKLKYQPGKEIANALHMIGTNLQYAGVSNLELVNAVYSAQYLEVNNSVVITGTQDAVQKLVALLDELDRAPKQVFLEVLIIDTTLSNSLDFGVQWIGLGDEQDKLAYGTGLLSNLGTGGPNLQGTTTGNPGARYVAATGTPPPTIPNPGRDIALPTPAQLQGFPSMTNSTEAFGFGIIGNILSHNGQSFLTLGALISALEEEQTTKLVLNPRIMAQDTQPADIFVGQNIPYQTTSSVIQQTGSVTQNIQYQDVGIHLKITPTISPNNIVSMDIDQTVAELLSTQGTLTPTTAKTLTTTRLHVPDGCFLVMSGHISDTVTTIRSGVPCLGTLPLIGPTFSRNVDQREKRNLIMFMRPKVLTNITESLCLTNQEGYDYNWESSPDAMVECGPKQAPECETYPALECPRN